MLLSFETNHPLIPAKLIHILPKHKVRSYHVFLLYTFSHRENYVLYKARTSKNVHRKHFHSPPYRPQSNGKIEGFHRFLKTCISKHINYRLEWDELTPMATACYNFFPNYSARESAFFVMFGRYPINKLNMLLHVARHYFHDDNGLPNLEALKNIYQVVAQQLLNSRE